MVLNVSYRKYQSWNRAYYSKGLQLVLAEVLVANEFNCNAVAIKSGACATLRVGGDAFPKELLILHLDQLGHYLLLRLNRNSSDFMND